MSEDDLTQFDDLISELDADDLKNAGSKKPIKPNSKVSTKHGKMTRKKRRNSDLNPFGNNPFEKTTTHQGTLTAGEPIKASSLIFNLFLIFLFIISLNLNFSESTPIIYPLSMQSILVALTILLLIKNFL